MFGFLVDSIDNAIDVTVGAMTGDLPSQRQVSKMLADGMTVAAIAYGAGVGVEVIEGILDDDSCGSD